MLEAHPHALPGTAGAYHTGPEMEGCASLDILAGSHVARQVEADVVMNLNEQRQQQLGVDVTHTAHATADGQKLT